ncbi:MAG: hypothetical protein ACO1O3_15920 [Sphingobium sp.]
MRGLAIAALALSAAAIASPATAQIVARHPSSADAFRPNPLTIDRRETGPGTWRDMNDIRDRIDDARDAGAMSRAEARQFRRETRMIDSLATRLSQDGLSASERQELETRALYLRGAVTRPRSK